MKKPFIFLLAFTLGCTATSSTPAPQQAKPSQFKNLQVLPQDISRDELLATMRSFTRSLGVRCDFCHAAKAEAAPAGERPEMDFPSDAKDEKRNARVMIRMTREINASWVSKLEHEPNDTAAPGRVVCWTCHRGKPQPEGPPPPPAG